MTVLCRLLISNSSIHKLARCKKFIFIPAGLELNYINKECCYSSTSGTWRVLFFGNDAFSLQSLTSLAESCAAKNLIRHLEVVTLSSNEDSVINKYAKENNLKLHMYPCDVKENEFDIGVVTSFGRLIPEKVISAFPLGMINVHASLLPRWRGAAPIFHAIKNGDEKTGVSVVRIMPKKFDIGNVIIQREIPLGSHELYPELYEKLAKLGGKALEDVMERLPNVLDQAVPQDESLVTAAPKISPKVTYIDWNTMSSKNVYDLYRATYGFYNLRTKFKDKIVQLLEIGTVDNVNLTCNVEKSPGLVFFDEKRNVIVICCKDSNWISVGQITLPGKKAMTARNFYNGFFKNRNKLFHYFAT